MSFIEPKGYTPAEFKQYVGTLHWVWKPKFIVLHNTSEPSLKQWQQGNTDNRTSLEQYEHWRCGNLNSYYKHQLGWHSGPHLFISPNAIWNTCDLTFDGVHCSCWNHISLGVEMVGDYAAEEFNAGDGAKVRDLTVDALAILHERLQLSPLPYMLGAKGLHRHKDCVRDNHDCPGKHVDIQHMRELVAAKMKVNIDGKELLNQV